MNEFEFNNKHHLIISILFYFYFIVDYIKLLNLTTPTCH
jgi:hypothetical protein